MQDDTRTFHLLRNAPRSALSEKQLLQLQLAESDPTGKKAAILVADDSDHMRALLTATLGSLGYQNVSQAKDGVEALEMLNQSEFDLLLLDIEMPTLDGFGVLEALKDNPFRGYLPVIVISGLNDLDAVVRCIELGAEDYLTKPFNPVLLRARVGALLERKRMRDVERLLHLELEQEKLDLKREQEKSERLLLNILPKAIAERLKQGEQAIAESHACVSVLFADLVGFTALSNRIGAAELVSLLNELFSRFDRLADRHGLEKIKTIGDCYLVVGGLPLARPDHAEAVAEMAMEMSSVVADLSRERNTELSLRIGINSGPVVAGVIGRSKFTYDLWGQTVNLASRMQSTSPPNRIHVAPDTSELLREKFLLTEAGKVNCKGLGMVSSYLLDGKKP